MGINWHELLVPTISLWEMVLRGTAIYLFLVIMMRLFRRDSGALGTADLMVVVVIADAAQNAMSADYHSITEGAVLIATIFGWNYGLDWAAFRSPLVRRLLQPDPLLLVKDGVINRKHLRSEMLTKDDLMEQLREHGVDDLRSVRECYLEADGRVSVLLVGGQGAEAGQRKAGGAP